MHISHGTRVKRVNPANGYGYATTRVISSLTELGHSVKQNDPTAPVQMWFDQPHHWTWNKDLLVEKSALKYTHTHQYRIGYHPWESTQLKDDWVKRMNKCDEIWTPSPLIAEWYESDGIHVPIYVYEHGVDDIWTKKPREPDGTIRFLHIGGEAARKGAQLTMDAIRRAFPDRKDVSLTMKMVNAGWNIEKIGKTTIINKELPLDELVELYHSHDVFVYPSYGEGFGLTPLQAMATGMPTITLPAWAPYRRFLDPNLEVDSVLRTSPWHNTIHPGKMFRPDTDSLVSAMQYAADNYDKVHEFAQAQVAGIRKEYNWNTLTAAAFNSLETRI